MIQFAQTDLNITRLATNLGQLDDSRFDYNRSSFLQHLSKEMNEGSDNEGDTFYDALQDSFELD